MQKINTKIIFILILMTILGCASHRVDLIKKGVVEVENITAKGIHVSQVYAYQENSDLVIGGEVRRKSLSVVGAGHIDIAIIDPRGKILKQISTRYYPRAVHRKGKKRSLFELRLPNISLTPGSKIRVVYHNY